MMKQATDCTCGIGADRSRSPFGSTSLEEAIRRPPPAQPATPLRRDLCLLLFVVVADEHAPALRRDAAVGAHLVLQLEALGPNLDGRTPTSTSSPNAIGDRKSTSMRARIRLLLRIVTRAERGQERDAGGLHVRQEHRVVHVSRFRRGSAKRTVSRYTNGKPSTGGMVGRRLDERRADAEGRSGHSRNGSGMCRPTSSRPPRRSSSRGVGRPSTQPRPEAKPRRRWSSCCGPSGRPTCSWRSATRGRRS